MGKKTCESCVLSCEFLGCLGEQDPFQLATHDLIGDQLGEALGLLAQIPSE
jgi:hypothetical protein